MAVIFLSTNFLDDPIYHVLILFRESLFWFSASEFDRALKRSFAFLNGLERDCGNNFSDRLVALGEHDFVAGLNELHQFSQPGELFDFSGFGHGKKIGALGD